MILFARCFLVRSRVRAFVLSLKSRLRTLKLVVLPCCRWTLLSILILTMRFLCMSRIVRIVTIRAIILAPMWTVRIVRSSSALSLVPTSMVTVRPFPRMSLRSLVSMTTCGISQKRWKARRWRLLLPRSARLRFGRMVLLPIRCALWIIRSLSSLPRLLTVKGISHDLWIDSNVGRIIMSDPIIENLSGYFVVEHLGKFDVDRYYLLNFIPD